MTQNNLNGKGMLAAALAGVVAGAVAGVLLAPKSGAETREDLAGVAEKMKNEILDRVQKLSKITRTAYNEVVDTVVREYQNTKEVTADQAAQIKDELGKSYDRIKEDLQETDEDDDTTANPI